MRNDAVSARLTGSFGQNRLLVGGLQPLVIPARARAAASSRCTVPETSTNGWLGAAGRASARTRKLAISPLVVMRSGQNKLFAGGLHPLVIPAAARASIFAACSLPTVSPKPAGAAEGSSKARTNSDASSARVRGRVGQNNVLAGGLHPLVIPAALMALMLGSWTLPSSSMKAPAASGGVACTGTATKPSTITAATTIAVALIISRSPTNGARG